MSRFLRARSIRAYLMTLVAVTALPLVALLVHATVQEWTLTRDQGRLRAHTLADATATSTRAFISVIHEALAFTATRWGDDLLQPASCRSHVTRINETLAELPNVLVSAPDGRILCSSHPPDGSDTLTVADRDWFQQVLRGSEFAVGTPVIGKITGTWVVALAVPVRGPANEVRAVLAASVPLIRFQGLVAGVTLGPRDLVTISNFDRVIVARSKDPDLWVGKVLPPPQSDHEDVERGFVGTEGRDAEGVERSWASVEIPELGWTVDGGIPRDEVLAAAFNSVRDRILLGCATLLLVAFLAYLVQHRITSSLRLLVRLTGSTEEVEVVDIPPGTPREIQAVGQRFNRTLLARLRAEREERRAKERFRSIVDNAVLGIYVSTEDGAFLEVNPAFATLMGYETPEALVDAGPEVLYRDPQQRQRLIEAYQEGDLVDGLELDWQRKDGSPVVVRLWGKVLPSVAGKRAFEIMVEDITERRLLEDQLHITQKMEAVGRLAGGLAHDFNNVLTVIRVNAELARAEGVGQDTDQTSVEEIIRATEGAQRLTRQLLSFSRRRGAEPKLVRPNEVIRGVEKMLVRIIGEDVRVEADLAADVPWVSMDPGHLEQVIMNLAVNARDALPEGGRILIETRVTDRPPVSHAAPTDPALEKWVVLRVEDDGIGMDDQIRSHIFEPFFTTKDAGHGTGLGLSTAYALVTGAGGHIAVDSAPGEGTRFDVWLPAVFDAPPEEGDSDAGEEDLKGGGETVLLVEDNSAVRRAVHRTLEGAGYRVLVARDGEEGIEHLHGYRGHIDLVLTDVVMPNVSGPELADHVDRVRPSTPILFMSGYTADHPMAERIARKGVDFIPKPFEISDLLARVKDALRGTDPAAEKADENEAPGA